MTISRSKWIRFETKRGSSRPRDIKNLWAQLWKRKMLVGDGSSKMRGSDAHEGRASLRIRKLG